MKCYYHRVDFDGECSAAIVKLKYSNCTLMPVNYGDPIDFSDVMTNEQVWIVDFSFPSDKMRELVEKVGPYNVTWIDHHKTSIEKAEFPNLPGVRQIGQAACELTWNIVNPDQTMPLAVKLLGRYDVWDLQHKDYTFAFQCGMRANKTNPLTHLDFWEKLLNADVKAPGGTTNNLFYKLLADGAIIYQYEQVVNAEDSKVFCFESELDGHSAICVNRPRTSSAFFDEMLKEKEYDLQIVFWRKKSYWKISLYSVTAGIDVSAIASKYGGGGHKGAAGFECKKLPFDIGEE